MKFAYTLFAEGAEIKEGRLDVTGLDLIALQFPGDPPWVQPSMVFLLSVHFDQEECGRMFRFTGDLTGPDRLKIEPHMEGSFRAPSWNPQRISRMSVVLNLAGVTFPKAGSCVMDVRVEDEAARNAITKQIPLSVRRTEPESQPI
jgi:hypothetical protein